MMNIAFQPDPRKAFFDREAPGWDQIGEDYTQTERFETWFRGLGLCPGQSILEIGCGTGTVLSWFLEAVGAAGRVAAVDLSAEMLARARDRCEQRPPLFSQGEARKLPLADAVFDHAFVINAFPHLKPHAEALSEIRRVLRPGGRVHITHFCGRDFINQIHRQAGKAVCEDLLPPAAQMAQTLRQFGFQTQHCTEEKEFYFVCAGKSLAA